MLHDLTSYVVGRLLLAAVLGGIIGLERELRHKPAGLRTNMLISLGAALFTIISWQMADIAGGDHTASPRRSSPVSDSSARAW